MLPVRARLRDRQLLASTVRRGTSARRRNLVVHYLRPTPAATAADMPVQGRVAFAVSRAVGGSVVRHRVVRKLRPLMVERLDQLPEGSTTVVRALPRSATATSAELAADLNSLLPQVIGAAT